MNTKRSVRCKEQTRDPLGFKLCLVCKGKLPKRRRSYCSDECWLRNTPRMIRAAIERRDKGVCAACGCQCKLTFRARIDLRIRLGGAVYDGLPEWQADHITPVVEGGGLCGIDGYRTLCTDCHKRETAALARRLAEKRRAAGTLFQERGTA